MPRAAAARGAARPARLGGPLVGSLLLHALAVAGVIFAASRRSAPPALPPIYRVDIVAAPPGPRAQGVVSPEATPPAQPEEATPPPRAETAPREMAAPVKRPAARPRKPSPPATPTIVKSKTRPAPNTPQTRAGGGPEGGRGTDVATVRTEGIEFPYPGYLNNIVRQIAVRFEPDNPRAPLRAEVAFLVHRDGSVSNFRFVQRSGAYAFDLEAQGAVEAAARARAFGPLPQGFPDDVLPVIFSFDPRLLR